MAFLFRRFSSKKLEALVSTLKLPFQYRTEFWL